MATCSSVPAWQTPWTAEPDGLQSVRPSTEVRMSWSRTVGAPGFSWCHHDACADDGAQGRGSFPGCRLAARNTHLCGLGEKVGRAEPRPRPSLA